MSAIDDLLDPIKLPLMLPVRQHFERPVLHNLEASIAESVRAGGYLQALRPGQTVAISAGSRGISNLALVIRTLVREVRAAGADPFVFPAMGSHGGATAKGQAEMVQGLGIDENTVEAPIRSSMDTVLLATTADGLPVYMDKLAAESDGIIVVNRIKPHVAFRGPYESGLMKMLAIGLGKQKGADFCHRMGFGHMAVNIPAIGNMMVKKAPILCAVGLVENAYHETALAEVMHGRDIEIREPELLSEARRLAPRIFFDELDVLVLDEIGKNIAGTGFDTNVVGRFHTPFASGGPNITRVLTLDLTDQSHGNANGLGILDFTTKRAFEKFSPEHTYPNSLTSTVPTSVKVPMVLKNDRQAIQAAVKTCNVENRDTVRLVRAKNTVELDQIWVSAALEAYCRAHEQLEVVGNAEPFNFNSQGNLL